MSATPKALAALGRFLGEVDTEADNPHRLKLEALRELVNSVDGTAHELDQALKDLSNAKQMKSGVAAMTKALTTLAGKLADEVHTLWDEVE